ncbi:MAG TPA: hypothetical protein VH680_17485 [Gemmatimonadales bacterium]|jgi:hypothetical protein
MSCSPGWIRYLVASALVLPTQISAQDSSLPFVYATYFECDPARESRVDALTRDAFAPLFDQRLAAKQIMAWGWLAHNLGGNWRRVSYVVAPSRTAVLEAQSGLAKDFRARQSKALTEFNQICPTHDDYLWQAVATSQPAGQTAQARPPAAYSIYYECSNARESRADTLVMQAFAPIWTRYVKAGGLKSWTWQQHIVGGKYRRLLVLDGASHEGILASTDSVLAAVAKERPAEGREFSEICPSHQDYLWDIQVAKP